MTEQVERWICIKFYVKLEHSSAETIQMTQAFGDNAISAAQMEVWQKCFKDGRESVESDPHSGKSATSRTPENVKCAWTSINKDQRLTVQALEADLEIPKTTVYETLTQDLWNVSWQILICSFCYQSRRNIMQQLLMTWFKPLPMNQISSRMS